MSTPTPRTNRAWNVCGDDNAEAAWAFAQKLEYELAAEREKVQILERENAALRIIQAQDKENYQCAMKASMAVEEQLKSENAALREDLEELQRVVIETRLAAVNGMNEIRSALGLPLGHEDKSGKRVLDYVQQLKCENTGLLEAILNAPNSVCKELDRRSAARKEAQP